MHIKTEQHHSEGILEDVVTMETHTDLNKHEMNLALNQDVKLHVEYNCPKYDNHVTIKTEPRSPNSVNMGYLMADTDENLTVKSENQFIDMLEDDGHRVVKIESSLPDFDKIEMLKKEPDSSEYITDTEVLKLPSAVFQQTANMMHIQHSTEPLGTSTNTLSLYKPGSGKQDNRHVETGNGMPSLPITDTPVPENNNAC
ncbi:uncharacterized protein LOC127723849 [Mytilus californianus]|uniref:uncharacterized protein LOC127723849 n=1 Tax=Mytilus californianus TaxID=6549 RepID=UPI0022486CD4|nr:uncharacterized protein LOC127723849 [Mytilus californianus]